jgi:hypothetical protein
MNVLFKIAIGSKRPSPIQIQIQQTAEFGVGFRVSGQIQLYEPEPDNIRRILKKRKKKKRHSTQDLYTHTRKLFYRENFVTAEVNESEEVETKP